MQRREFLKNSTLAFSALLLGACGPTPPNNESDLSGESITDQEWEMLKNEGVIDQYLSDLNTSLSLDDTQTESSSELLFSYLSSSAGEKVIRSLWQKVSTPPELAAVGLKVGEVGSTVFQGRIVNNGGFGVYVRETNSYLKMIPSGTVGADYLRESYPVWKAAWARAYPEEVGRISLTEDIGLWNGNKYTVLHTPNGGVNFKSYIRYTLPTKIPAAELNSQVIGLLERYYLNVLLPMNQQGFIQYDINLKNIIVREVGGVTQLMPVDLDGRMPLIAKDAILEWQWNQLAIRMGRVGYNLPTFQELQLKYPVEIGAIPFRNLGQNLEAISTRIYGRSVNVLIPRVMTDGLSGDDKWNLVKNIQDQIQASIKKVRIGSSFPVFIKDANGVEQAIEIVKTSAYGEKIPLYGGRSSEILGALNTGLKYLNTTLIVAFIASETKYLLDPDFVVNVYSSVYEPNQAMGNGMLDAHAWLRGIYDTVMNKKKSRASSLASFGWGKLDDSELYLGVTKQMVTSWVEDWGMSVQDVNYILNELAASTLALAPSDVVFGSTVPLVTDGLSTPLNAVWSAIEDETNETVILYSNNTQDDKSLVEPVCVFTHEKSDPDPNNWSATLLSGDSFTLTLTREKIYNFQCSLAQEVANGNADFSCSVVGN